MKYRVAFVYAESFPEDPWQTLMPEYPLEEAWEVAEHYRKRNGCATKVIPVDPTEYVKVYS